MEIFKKKNAVRKNNKNEKEELKKLYIDERMSIQKISKIYGCHRDTIERKLKKYDILIRPRGSFLVDENGEYQKHIIEEKRKKKLNENEIKEKNDLIKKYIDERMTIQKISNIYKCHRRIIDKKLREYGINIRPRGSFLVDENGEFLKSKCLKGKISNMEYFNEKAEKRGFKDNKEYQKHVIEEKRKKDELPENCMWTKDELEDLYAYNKQNLTPRQIGKLHIPFVSDETIRRWIDIFGIERKTQSEATSGKNSGNWQGGISNGPYCEEFTSEVKEYERERWYRRCVLCNKTEEEEGRRMSIHHVDYNKNQGCDYTQWKLIPLCKSCNSYVNGDRNYYEHLFTNFIIIRKALEEFDWNIDYKSIGTIDERCDILDKLKYKNKKIYNDFKYDWRSLGI